VDKDASRCGLRPGSSRHITSHRRRLTEGSQNIVKQGAHLSDFLKCCMQRVWQVHSVNFPDSIRPIWVIRDKSTGLYKQCVTLTPIINSTRRLIICKTFVKVINDGKYFTELCKKIVTAPVLISQNLGFKFQPGDRLL
jgi:hypothetical protein